MTASLPPDLVARAPTIDDLQGVAGLIIAWDIAEYGESDYTVTDIRDEWRSPGFTPATDAMIVVAPEGQIVGYEQIQHIDARGGPIDVDGYVHPDYNGRGIGTYLLRWVEARVQQAVSNIPPDAPISLHATINGANRMAHALFTAEGYAPIRHFWRMQIDLPEPPPEPE